MTELISLQEMSVVQKISLLQELGLSSDGIYVLDEQQEHYLDKYTKEPVKVENMLIVQGSILVLDNNPLSVSSYLEEYGDVL